MPCFYQLLTTFVFDLSLKEARLDELDGQDPNASIRLKMKYLFSDTVLDEYTWRGTQEKAPFRDLKSINKLILNSVRNDFPGIKYKFFAYKKYMIEWLKHSFTRQRTVTYTYPRRKKKAVIDEEENDDYYDDDDDEE